MSRPPLPRQLAWARGQASQRRRLLSRLLAGSRNLAAIDRARSDLAVAEAIVASLEGLAAPLERVA